MREVIESIHRLDKVRGANAYLIEADDRAVVVDTGVASGADGLVAELRAARIPRITDVVVTHYDPDHIGSAAAVQRETGATVWLGAADQRIVRGEVPHPRGRAASCAGSAARDVRTCRSSPSCPTTPRPRSCRGWS
ncbi:MBL fold metallo-hydrolase [Leifsonia xyli]|uniref:MBL fold metallo-hydrolase n=1 Tax=Leifsonia xyli TaxID=1575 RepID=UPI003D67F855